jgi:hypothetical protein
MVSVKVGTQKDVEVYGRASEILCSNWQKPWNSPVRITGLRAKNREKSSVNTEIILHA